MDRDLAWVLEEKYSSNAEAPGFARDRERLAEGEPVAYVIGFQPFLGLKIYLDSKPLIPRPETEWWTEQLLHSVSAASEDERVSEALRRSPDRAGGNSPAGEYSVLRNAFGRTGVPAQSPAAPKAAIPSSRTPLLFLDLCAGSGAIGCAALARLPDAQVYFGELDKRHEATIRKNIRENGLDESRAHVGIGDLFEPFGELAFDVIAANPPYIPQDRTLEQSVAAYEPEGALYAGEDGLDLIRRIAAEFPKRLSPTGLAWVECDSGHAEAARALFEDAGLPAAVIPDQYGEPRVLEVSSKQ